MTEPDYKELSKELYEMLKEATMFIANYDVADRVSTTLQKYKEATTRGTGRTTILYHKAITEALENPGVVVEFNDHHPYTWEDATFHRKELRIIINKLGYDIEVGITKNKVFLINRFDR